MALNVLYQFDQNYLIPAGTSITTLLKNNQDLDELTLYIAAKDVAAKDIEKLNLLIHSYDREVFYVRTDQIYEKLQEIGAGSWNGSLATWIKMFILDEIPETVDQLLYLDSDTLIPGSLEELSELDLGEHPAACVIDSSTRYSKERLHLRNPYYNAGVIYFNLKHFRQHGLQRKMLDHLESNIQRYPVNDQDLLNDFFRGHILTLSPKYNFQMPHFLYSDQDYLSAYQFAEEEYYTETEIEEARNDIRIIHFLRFIGDYPWHVGNVHPCKEMFLETVEGTLWKDEEYMISKTNPFIFRAEKMLYHLLPHKLFLQILLLKQKIDKKA